ncbi:MAG: ABC transporter permease subunit [Chitinivibrionales bacterium]|nr:ABC transporter permease subunit [Chitinivibrionales bacterium]
MLKFVLKRLFFETIPSLFVIATLTFFLIRLAPGGPFSAEKNVAPEIIAQLKAHYGLDKPLAAQYGNYLLNALRGDLGPSFRYVNSSVTGLIRQGFAVSLELGLWSLLIALLCGITLGVLAALNHNRAADWVAMIIATTGICIPTFVLGPLLVLVFALNLGLVNVSGWNNAGDRILPSLTLGLAYCAYIARLTRGGMLDILSQDFIRTAHAKGVHPFMVIVRHALKGGLLSTISFLGPAIAGLITGSFIVETIFNIPGLGRLFVTAAFNRDYTLIMGTVLFYAFLIIVFNTAVDILQALLNPKMRVTIG